MYTCDISILTGKDYKVPVAAMTCTSIKDAFYNIFSNTYYFSGSHRS